MSVPRHCSKVLSQPWWKQKVMISPSGLPLPQTPHPTIPAQSSSLLLILHLVWCHALFFAPTWVFRRRPRSLRQSWIWPQFQGGGSAGSCDSPPGSGPQTGAMRNWRMLAINNQGICRRVHKLYPHGILTLWSSDYTGFKGSVKWKKRGGVSGINRSALYSSTFPQIFYFYLKDTCPLNSKKRIWAEQLFMCSDRIMWLPGSKIR